MLLFSFNPCSSIQRQAPLLFYFWHIRTLGSKRGATLQGHTLLNLGLPVSTHFHGHLLTTCSVHGPGVGTAEDTDSFVFLVTLRTFLVLFEILSRSVMFGVSPGIIDVCILQIGKLRLRKRKRLAKASHGGARAREHLSFPAAREWNSPRVRIRGLLKGLNGSINVRSSQRLGHTSWPLPVGWMVDGDLPSCC